MLLAVGVVVGLATGLFAAGVPYWAPHFFTPQEELWAIMRSLGPQAFWATFFCSLDVTASGCLIATKQLNYLVRAMFLTLGVVALYFGTGLQLPAWGLPNIWWGLVLFFAARAAQSTTRLVNSELRVQTAYAG